MKLLIRFWSSILVQPIIRERHYWKNMASQLLEPPAHVRGMQVLDRDAFNKIVRVPCLHVPESRVNRVMPHVKKLLLKMERMRPVRAPASLATTADSGENALQREILLHPIPVTGWTSLPTAELEKLEVSSNDFHFNDLPLGYENWRADEILKSVLPADEEGLTSYSRIGHIIHLNLRDHLQPYKQLIGEVLRDKVPGCRTVVNKAASIDNTYRNFQFELICGDGDYKVETKENGIPFEFDFSLVYWNPRLSTEHERVVKMLQPGDVLYDVFAGVGPFSVPAAKKRCHVLANDLNPESYRWLVHNAKRNKCSGHVQTFNKDGREFIRHELRADLLKRWQAATEEVTNDGKKCDYGLHITMNLPAMAVEFLDAFRGLFADEAALLRTVHERGLRWPLVHVYCFAKGEATQELALSLAEQHLGLPLQEQLEGVHFVRNVAPNKDMYRISFRLNEEILASPKADTDTFHKRKAVDEGVAEVERDLAPLVEAPPAKIKCT